jgi:hypothetical protein
MHNLSKNYFFYVFRWFFFLKKKTLKKFTTTAKKLQIFTQGLDDFVLENLDSYFIEIFLQAENPNKPPIIIDKNKLKLK